MQKGHCECGTEGVRGGSQGGRGRLGSYWYKFALLTAGLALSYAERDLRLGVPEHVEAVGPMGTVTDGNNCYTYVSSHERPSNMRRKAS
jgi:hypothetical protein